MHPEVPVLIITSSIHFWQVTSCKKMFYMWSKINPSYVEEFGILFISLNSTPIENFTFCYTCYRAFTLVFFWHVIHMCQRWTVLSCGAHLIGIDPIHSLHIIHYCCFHHIQEGKYKACSWWMNRHLEQGIINMYRRDYYTS